MAKGSIRLKELHNIFEESGISLNTVMENDRFIYENEAELVKVEWEVR